MNRQRYRLVFNRARGLLMAVAETATRSTCASGQTGGGHPGPGPGPGPGTVHALVPTLRLALWLAWGLVMGVGLAMPAGAYIRADRSAPGTQRATVLTAPNGVPLVNIQTPSAAGVSRNTFSQFDVERPGAILNNSRTAVQSVLGGWVQANPWLAQGAARVILNEVNSSDPSQLRGYIEVAGQRAQVVIANPAGITCDGCGFINTPRATLTTGTPLLVGGDLAGLRVERGAVRIVGDGLDGRQADFTAIIARAAALDAEVHANDASIVAGAQDIALAGDGSITSITERPSGSPGSTQQVTQAVMPRVPVAIDVASLGGMYAGRIFLVGNGAGVGVRNAGHLGASAGDIVLTAEGRLENSGTLNARVNAHLEAQAGVVNSGTIHAQGDVHLTTGGDIDHRGVLVAGGDMTLSATGAVRTDDALLQSRTLRLTADSVSNRGGEWRAGHIRIETLGPAGLTNRGLIDGEQVDIDATTLSNLGPGQIYGDRVALRADTLMNQAEANIAPVIAARDRLDLGVGALDNSEHALIFSGGDLALGGFLDRDRRAAGQANTVRNASATIEAQGRVSLAAREVVNADTHFRTEVVDLPAQQVTELAGEGSPQRYAPGTPDVYVFNDESDHLHTPEGNHETWYRYEFTRQVSETRVAHSDPGRILSGGDMQITADRVLNDKGHLLAGGALRVRAGTLVNTEPKGTRVTRDVGEVFITSREHDKGRDATRVDGSTYQPPERVETLSLSPSISRGQATVPSRGHVLAPVPSIDVRVGHIDPRVLSNSLFRPAPDPASRYLVETDPRFTQYRQWLGSDYLLKALTLDPDRLQKRLGDGFYEQRLLREQVMQLTGQRFLAGYADDEAQFRALMDNGAAFARAHALRPGVALSAQQMSQLTTDIVWLVELDVPLPDGRTARAWVPQLYTVAREGHPAPSIAVIAGRSVDLNVAGELVNSGTIQARDALRADARSVSNLGGRMAGADVALRASDDLDNLGGQIRAEQRLMLDAGRDLHVASTTATTASAQGSRTAVDSVASVEVTSPGGSLQVNAGRDVHLTAADVRSDGTLAVQAGRDLNLGTLDLSAMEVIERDAANYRRESQRTQAGSSLQAQGDLLLQAGQDLTARAASVTSSQGALVAYASRDLHVAAGESQVQLDEAHRETSGGIFSRKTTDTYKRLDETTAQASTFSGRSAEVIAGRDMAITGSQVASDEGTRLEAGRDITVQAATDTRATLDERHMQRSGVFGSGGLGVTLGTQSQSSQEARVSTFTSGSTVGSIHGDVQIAAGQTWRQVGSDVLAPQGHIEIEAQRVEVVEARETQRLESATQTRQSGVTLSLSNPVVTAAQTVQRVREAAHDAKDPRMKALAALTQALAIYEAGSAVADHPELAGGVNLNISLGSSQSASRASQFSDTASGSRVIAGGDVRVRAAGAGAQSDIVVQGSRVEAGGAVDLIAEDAVRLLAARDVSRQHSEDRQSGAAVGVSVGVGSPRPGLNLTARASQANGRSDGEDQTWVTTQVGAGTAVGIQSGADTTLRGAVVRAPQVTGRIGGDLVVESLQDTARSASQQSSASVGGSYGSSGLQVQASSSRGHADMQYANVAARTGVVAGDGGFDLRVQGRTDLKAGQLASSEEAAAQGRNRLVTGTLATSDLENSASAQSSSSGFAVSNDMLTRGKYGVAKAVVANTMLNASESMQATGQTRAAVSAGDIVITDEARQKALTGQIGAQAVAMLSRDTRHAHVGVLRPDPEIMQRAVNARRVIQQETFRAITVFTDEAYRSRFETKPGLFKVTCRSGANCVSDPKQVVYTPATPEEVANAPAGAVLAVNGILNSEKRGAELAYQNAESKRTTPLDDLEKPREVYLMHIAPSRHTLSELMGAAYEKIVAESDYRMANFLGYTSGQALYADLLKSRGQTETLSLAHSRGTLVQVAAFTILTNTKNESDDAYRNPNLSIRGVGGATSVESYTSKGLEVLGHPSLGDRITFSYFSNDPVSTSSLVGGNSGVSTLSDLWQVWKTSNSMHSCYGSGAPGCTQVESPAPGGPQGTPDGNAKLVKFVGGKRDSLRAPLREGDQ